MRSTVVVVLLVASLFAPASARAQGAPPKAPTDEPPPPSLPYVSGTLEYSVAKNLGQCPDVGLLHAEIASRMGYDPFAPKAQGVPFGHVRVTIKSTGMGLRAFYEYPDENGVSQTHTYTASGWDSDTCALVIEGVAANLSIPLTVFALRHQPEPSAPPPPSPP
ncbi:MAG: hypothetical protein KC492_09705, partial [Myxococcales bacterium]|nr:hypothetical protein [Myxococcales bacterium]